MHFEASQISESSQLYIHILKVYECCYIRFTLSVILDSAVVNGSLLVTWFDVDVEAVVGVGVIAMVAEVAASIPAEIFAEPSGFSVFLAVAESIIFCRTSLIFNCRQTLLGKMSECFAWKAAVA